MTHSQLIYFISVAEQLNLTKVAGDFHISQPAVSAAIRDLEKEFQLPLFVRRCNKLVLTPNGERIYRRAKSLLQHYDDFYNFVSSDLSSSKNCSISFAPNVAALYLADMYLYAKEHMSDYKITMQEDSNDNVTHMLKNNQLDLACFACPEDRFAPGLNYIPVGKMKLSMCAHPNVFYRKKSVISITELKDVPLVLHQRTSMQNSLIRDWFRDAGISPNIIYESHQTSTLCTMVRRKIALGCYLPEIFFKDDEDIAIYQLENQHTFPVYCVYKDKTSNVSALLQMFKGFFRQADV